MDTGGMASRDESATRLCCGKDMVVVRNGLLCGECASRFPKHGNAGLTDLERMRLWTRVYADNVDAIGNTEAAMWADRAIVAFDKQFGVEG